MFQSTPLSPLKRRGRLSLSVYISLLLALAALIPVLATIGSIEVFLRPALIEQVSADMERDAQTKVQLIDAYLAERLNDIKSLSQATPVQDLLGGHQNSRDAALDILFTAQHRDVANSISISLLDTQSHVVLSYPAAPLHHGKYLILPGILQQLQQSGTVLISDAFYDQVGNNPSVDIYSRVINSNYQLLGVVRASLSLQRVWAAVDSDAQANGSGSFAMILDENGVRIAYSNPDRSGFTHPAELFTLVSPLSAAFQQRIADEDLYGNSSRRVSSVVDQGLVAIQHNAQSSAIFQTDPPGQNQTFEAARYSSTVVPWTYFVYKPLNAVTGIADQQLLSVFLILLLLLILAILVGLLIGRRLALPILRSVQSLRNNSQSLKKLAGEEYVIVTEQAWMVEALQVALKSVKSYTDATSMASHKIYTIGTTVRQNSSSLDIQRVHRSLQEMVEAAQYIGRVAKHQEVMNQKLATTLRVTTQVTAQLTKGAKSTEEAATELEQVVKQLTSIVGEQKEHASYEQSI